MAWTPWPTSSPLAAPAAAEATTLDLAAIDTSSSVRGLLGVAAILAICWALSENRRRFPWRLAIGSLALQAALVAALFALPNAGAALRGLTAGVDALASATASGTQFVFSYLGGGEAPYAPQTPGAPPPFIFAFQVLPIILVVSALSAILWRWGVLRLVVYAFGFVFRRAMGLSGPSATAAAANVFMGMIEAPLVVRGYLESLSRSEIFLMIVLGLATVAGSTMAAYALILKDSLPNAAAHVLAASVLSAPAGVLLARVMIPEKPEEAGAPARAPFLPTLRYESTLDALVKGVADGLAIVFNVAAMLIVVVALVAIVNGALALSPPVLGAPLSLERVFGWAFAPAAYMIGVPWSEAQVAGELLGVKLFLTEFVAFLDLGGLSDEAVSERTRMILTYALCGFANVGSVGITIAGMTPLFPPERRAMIQELAVKALLPGFLATLQTAALVAAMPAALFK